MKHLGSILISFICCLGMMAGEPVLQVFNGKEYNAIGWEEIDHITYSSGALRLHLNNGQETSIKISDDLEIPSEETIPLIEINTEESLTEIPNKVDYKKAEFQLKGFGNYEDISESVSIRGRGNTSWSFPKKPYRLKFDKKVSLCGLPSAKNFVLLANYNDHSLIQNALAFKLGQMLNLPFTPSCIPVEVKLNGVYKGSYLLTNKPGINSGSVDIDEDNSIMWELDTSYDEDLKFMSPILNLPVMVSDPDMDEKTFEEWKADFLALEKAAINGNAGEMVDMDELARYILVYEILKNDEIGWPKSLKLFKTKGEKYIFGPIWDFDHCMGKIWGKEAYTTTDITKPVWKNSLLALLKKDSNYSEALKNHWLDLRQKLPELLNFLDEYSSEIKSSAERDHIIWQDLEEFEKSLSQLTLWLKLRFVALDFIL